VVSQSLFVFIYEDGIGYIIFCAVFWGLTYSGTYLIRSLIADVIDYDELLTGSRREGQYQVYTKYINFLN